MKAHTPEPIRCDDHGKIFYANGGCDAFVTDVHFARRIVACVNACAGIPTASLEGMEVGHLDSIHRQRDDLLAALEKAFAALESCTPGDFTTGHVIYPSFDESLVADAYCEARSAIASAKETK